MRFEEDIDELECRWTELLRKRPKTTSDAQEMEHVREALTRALLQQSAHLYEELSAIGIRIKSIWDLVNTPTGYPEAIPILVEHLAKPYHHRTKEGIVRALAVKGAKG